MATLVLDNGAEHIKAGLVGAQAKVAASDADNINDHVRSLTIPNALRIF